MDKLGSLASKLGGSKKDPQQQQQQPSGNAAQEDYVDKGLSSLEQKYGGGKIDATQMRSTNENITDGARDRFEEMTGIDVPDKISN